jgi:hypothetical protein
MAALDRVCAALDRHTIPYALIGAAALAARGVARSTYDIDLLTTGAQALTASVWEACAAEGAGIDIRRGDLDDPLAGVVRITYPNDRPVDVVVGKHAWQQRAVERAEQIAGGPAVVLTRDLVLLKLYAGGAQDTWDIRELLRVSDGALARDVTDDVSTTAPDMRQRWQDLHA